MTKRRISLAVLLLIAVGLGFQPGAIEVLSRARNWASDFGAVGDGSTDDTARLTAMILALENYETLVLRKPVSGGYYKITTPITIDKPLKIVGDGNMPEIRQTAESQHAFIVTSDNVTFEGIKITGAQRSTTRSSSESAVKCYGDSASSPRRNLRVLGCEITNFGGIGVDVKWIDGFEVRNNRIWAMAYAGIMATSGLHGVVDNNRISDIEGNTSNAYAISATRSNGDDLTVNPRSQWIDITDNIIDDVPTWSAIDTHAGADLTISGNVLSNCPWGISCTRSVGDTTEKYAPMRVAVTNNRLNSGVTDGSGSYGINVTGANQDVVVLGSPIEAAEGCVVANNTVVGYGKEGTTIAAIHFHSTKNSVCTGNSIVRPSPYGINFDFSNWGFVCTANDVLDVWSNSVVDAAAVTCRVTSGYAYGSVIGNNMTRGDKTASNVNVYGFRMCSTSLGSVRYVPGYTEHTASAGPLLDSAGLCTRTTARLRDFAGKTNGDGATADDAVFSAAVSHLPAGAKLIVDRPPSYWRLTSAWTLSKAITVEGEGMPDIRQVTSNTIGINVTADDVTINGLKLTGPQSASSVASESAIRCYGSSAASPRSNLTVRNCQISSWGQRGIDCKWLTGVDLTANKIDSIYQTGIELISVLNGSVTRNRVTTLVSGSGTGIYLSRAAVTSLSTDPRTARVTVSDNYVTGAINGIRGMGVEQCSVTSNHVLGASNGIRLFAAQDGSAAPTYAPRECSVANNTVASGVTDGSLAQGILIEGAELASPTPGSPVDLATGITVIGNNVRGHGREAGGNNDAGIWAVATSGLVVVGNNCVECAPIGINFNRDCYGFVCVGNNIRDVWSNTTVNVTAIATRVTDGYQFGTISGNNLTSGDKSATYLNRYGFISTSTVDTYTSVVYTKGFVQASVSEVYDPNYLLKPPPPLSNSGVPVTGTWAQGDVVWNNATATTLSTPIGWICTTPGGTGVFDFTPFYRGVSIITGSTTWDPGSLATGASESKDVTVSGASMGAQAIAGLSTMTSGMQITATVTSSTNVRVTITNVNATNPTDLGSGTVAVKVFP